MQKTTIRMPQRTVQDALPTRDTPWQVATPHTREERRVLALSSAAKHLVSGHIGHAIECVEQALRLEESRVEAHAVITTLTTLARAYQVPVHEDVLRSAYWAQH